MNHSQIPCRTSSPSPLSSPEPNNPCYSTHQSIHPPHQHPSPRRKITNEHPISLGSQPSTPRDKQGRLIIAAQTRTPVANNRLNLINAQHRAHTIDTTPVCGVIPRKTRIRRSHSLWIAQSFQSGPSTCFFADLYHRRNPRMRDEIIPPPRKPSIYTVHNVSRVAR